MGHLRALERIGQEEDRETETGKVSRIRIIPTNIGTDDTSHFPICVARSTGLHITKLFWLQVVLIAA